MPMLADFARKVAAAALKIVPVELGPWEGSMRSVTADLVPMGYAAQALGTETNFRYLPKRKSWKLRSGQTILFDTFSAGHEVTGLLPAKWGAGTRSKARWMEEFLSDSFTDNLASVATLVTRETVAAGLDDGRFSQLYVRDQVNGVNYTVGAEYGTAAYPSPGAPQQYKITPLWYDSGDGGLTRGVTEFARRFFLCGSRRFGKVGNWWYFPSVLGTPSRWRGTFVRNAAAVPAAALFAQGSSEPTPPPSGWEVSGTTPTTTVLWQAILTQDDGVNYARAQTSATSRTFYVGLNQTMPDSTTYTIHYRARYSGDPINAATYFLFGIICSGQQRYATSNILASTLTASFADYTATVTCDASNGAGAVAANTLELGEVASVGTNSYVEITYIYVTSGTGIPDTVANRLIPSGPLPPTHAGSLAGGSAITAYYARPDFTTDNGGWLGSGGGASYTDIDEVTPSDVDYINSNSTNGRFKCSLSDPGVSVNVGDAVTIRLRIFETVASGFNTLNVSLLDPTGVTTYRGQAYTFSSSFGWTDYSIALTDAQVVTLSTVSVTNLQLWFQTQSESAGDKTYISYAALEILPGAALSEGGWKGHDRFYHSQAYRFEDGSVWMPCIPRAPNDLLTNGYNLFTVDSSNPDLAYRKITWSNIPIGPYGTVSRLLLRTPKIDKTVDDNLQLNPYDLRVIWEIQDNTTTTYDDYFGDDLSLTLDVEKAFIRFDHMMPPRSRYFAGGDMRVAHSYGGQNPCAIILAPVGASADYDRNVADTSTTAYGQSSFYFRMLVDGSTDKLDLITSDGTTNTTTSFALLTTYNTLQKLVDGINNTSVSVNSMQWRAQLCPGASPDAAPSSALTPNARTITNCVMTSGAATIKRVAGGLSKVAIGTLVSHANFATGTYVSSIDSDILLTVSANSSATTTASITFYSELGDSPNAATANLGYQRAITNSSPSFLYFNKTYLNNYPLQKNATWMTVASPGAVKSAANCFSSKESNRFQPPVDPGIGTGIVAVDQGFVTYYAKKRAAIRPREGSSGGRDEDYRLIIINESSGCPAWNTVVAGNRCAVGLSPEGLVVSDLFRERIFSHAIWSHAASDSSTGTGDFSVDLDLAVAAAATDDDTSYYSARILRNALYVNYPIVTTAHPARQVVYDFSAAEDLNGIKAFFRNDGKEWGWSLPLTRSMIVMAEIRRSAGTILYGWNEQNQGSTGDGRIDRFEDGASTDNGTAFTGAVSTAWVRAGERDKLSAQEFAYEHSSPVGSTGSWTFHRSFSTGGDTNYTLTPGTSALVVASELKMLPTGARSAADACFLTYTQATGSARELRWLQLTLKRLPTYR